MVAKPLCPLYKNIIKPLDRARYPELRSLYDLLSQFKLQFDHELEGKVIDVIPSDLFIRSAEWAKERCKHWIDGAWLYPWLKEKGAVTKSKNKRS